MFTIEHDYDETVITLMDEDGQPLRDDVVVRARDEGVVLEQQGDDGTVRMLTLSFGQMRDLAAALDLPEGIYRRARAGRT